MLIVVTNGWCVQYDEPLALLRAEWRSNSGPEQVLPAFEKLLELLATYRIERLLLDCYHLPDLSLPTQGWLQATFLGAALRLPLRQVVHVISGLRIYNQHFLEQLYLDSSSTVRADVQYFSQVGPALGWLTGQAPHLPALLREWQGSYCFTHNSRPPTHGVAEPAVPYERG